MIQRRSLASSRGLAIAMLTLALLGCASHPDKIDAAYVSALKYEPYSCDQISLEMEAVEGRTDELYQALRKTRRADNWQAGVGILLLPTLFALEGGDGVEASEYAFLKGDYEALQYAALNKQCGMQSRSPAEQIEDSLTADTFIELPNNMRVSLSQMIGMLERAHAQGIISEDELNEAVDTAFRLLGSNTQQPTAQELDSLYSIINKTDLGTIARANNPIDAPSSRQVVRQENLSQPIVTEYTQRPISQQASLSSNTMRENDSSSIHSDAETHSPVEFAYTGSVASILQEYSHLESLEIDELPQWKILHFLEKAGLPSDTTVLAFIDTSVWQSGKNGVLFAEDGIYYTNDFVAGAGGSYFVSYDDIVMQAAPIHKRRYFYIGDDTLPKRGLIDFVGADTDLEEFSELISAIKTRYKVPEELVVDNFEPMF